ncbi:MAG: hypothetical protein WGN25_09060 [Candidatus Electrothrix sp. GW3-4]|uniref:hypothetical protein n=1 Tax=Candidatus Electrothrix sp. GW3-4 TaxID=3126740 RepID=UPI0030D2495E
MKDKTAPPQFCLSFYSLPGKDRDQVKVSFSDQSEKVQKKEWRHKQKNIFALGSH